jgi:CRISPR-associated protein Csm5
MKETIRFRIQPLAPIHLGCDEVYEPFSFVLDEKRRELVVFDPWLFFQEMEEGERKRFGDICRQGTVSSILQIYQFLRNRQAAGRIIDACPGLVERYRQTLALPLRDEKKIQQELNNFIIARTAFLAHDERPYIPGSAVKGALRTAYLNHLAQERKIPTPRGKRAARELEQILLDGGSFHTDPFRLLKVSDFLPVGDVRTRIVFAVNQKKKPSKFQARGPSQILEVIQSGAIFIGEISLEEPLPGAGIFRPLQRQTLLSSASSFFRQERSREDNELLDIGIKPEPKPEIKEGFLLRIGRHSGAESVTIEGHRLIRIMKGKGENPDFLDHATTLWLQAEEARPSHPDQFKPFGWAAVEELTDEQGVSYQKMEADWRLHREELKAPSVEKEPRSDSVERKTKEPAQKVEPTEVWSGAVLTWSPGNQQLTAVHQNKKASAQGKEMVPEALHKHLLVKRKSVTATVTVQAVGNAFRIIDIEIP